MANKDVETPREDIVWTGIDLPPEFCQYRDEGCELAASCLRCPFPRCVYEQKGEGKRWLRRLRSREIAKLSVAKKKKARELARMFGISRRTVCRALKVARQKKSEVCQGPLGPTDGEKPGAGRREKACLMRNNRNK